MVRGDRGDHGCQSKARLVIVTGCPVQPHEPYESIGCLEFSANWVPIPKEIHAEIGLGRACHSQEAFVNHFEGPQDNGEEDWQDHEHPDHVPGPDGYDHVLPD
eukprot:7996688-Heterocapsa_arctica.AAC.1